MKLDSVRIRNFRGFVEAELDLRGATRYLIAPNAGGKTSLLTAIARALGRDLSFSITDFADPEQEILIQATLSGFSDRQRSALGNHIQLSAGGPPTITPQVRAVWNESTETADVEHGYYPTGSRSRRIDRDAIDVVWLPTFRDPSRLAGFTPGRSLFADLLSSPDLIGVVDHAIEAVSAISAALGEDASFRRLLDLVEHELGEVIPNVQDRAYSVRPASVTRAELLAMFELFLAHLGGPVPLAQQSSGLGQLTVFALAILHCRDSEGSVLLVDEPELSLHPQAQRALARRLCELDAQVLMATHSANMLDRIDPRSLIRLTREQDRVVTVAPSQFNNEEATELSKYLTGPAAEALFAEGVVLVEGMSDLLALETAAAVLGVSLDALGVAIVPMHGAGKIKPFARLFGPRGLDLRMAGMCDEAEMTLFASGLGDAGVENDGDEEALAELGFVACHVDLEDEMIRAITSSVAVDVIQAMGYNDRFERFQMQPANRGSDSEALIVEFVRTRKVELAVPLAERLRPETIPPPIVRLIDFLCP